MVCAVHIVGHGAGHRWTLMVCVVHVVGLGLEVVAEGAGGPAGQMTKHSREFWITYSFSTPGHATS